MAARIRYLRHRELDGLEMGRLRHTKKRLKNGLQSAVKIFDCYTDSTTDEIGIPELGYFIGDAPRVMFSGDIPSEFEYGKIYYLFPSSPFLYTLYLDKSLTNQVQFSTDSRGSMTIYILDPIEEQSLVA